MRSKAPLSLIEQVIMLLVFALAAVLCLRAFVWADARSAENVRRDQALIQAQNAAEVLKSCGGDFTSAAEHWGGTWDGSEWTIPFDGHWQQATGDGTYLLRVSPMESELNYLGLAQVEVLQEETRLVALHVAWQEVAKDG